MLTYFNSCPSRNKDDLYVRMLTSSKTKDWHKWLEGIKYENETKIWLPHVGEMHRHIPTFNLEELI